jgi:hypothetical protein
MVAQIYPEAPEGNYDALIQKLPTTFRKLYLACEYGDQNKASVRTK